MTSVTGFPKMLNKASCSGDRRGILNGVSFGKFSLIDSIGDLNFLIGSVLLLGAIVAGFGKSDSFLFELL